MEKKEINASIPMNNLQERIDWINKNLVGKKETITLEEEKNGIFNYSIKVINKRTKNIVSSRGLTDKADVLQFLSGMEKAIQLII